MQNYAVWSVWEDGSISGPHNHLLLARQHIAHQLITHALFMWCTQFISLRAKNSVDDDDLLGQKWVLLLLMLMVGNILLMVLNKIWVQSFCIYLKCEWVWYFGCKKKNYIHTITTTIDENCRPCLIIMLWEVFVWAMLTICDVCFFFCIFFSIFVISPSFSWIHWTIQNDMRAHWML